MPNAPQLTPHPALTGILINELDQIKQAFILTLMDYMVAEVLSQQPPTMQAYLRTFIRT